jgi:acid phosphatase (class A)
MTKPRSIGPAALAAALAALALTTWPESGGARQDGPNPGIVSGSLPPGYLPRTSLPDSLSLLPPPPASGSAALARDEEARE